MNFMFLSPRYWQSCAHRVSGQGLPSLVGAEWPHAEGKTLWYLPSLQYPVPSSGKFHKRHGEGNSTLLAASCIVGCLFKSKPLPFNTHWKNPFKILTCETAPAPRPVFLLWHRPRWDSSSPSGLWPCNPKTAGQNNPSQPDQSWRYSTLVFCANKSKGYEMNQASTSI